MQEHYIVGHASNLAEVMGGHDDACALLMDGLDDFFDVMGGGGVEARRWLIQEQNLGLQCPGASQRQFLLLAEAEDARRGSIQPSESNPAEHLIDARLAFVARKPT